MEKTSPDYPYYVGQLQTIHALRDELELAPNQYQGLLEHLTGSRSAKFMTPEQREKVISFMRIHRELDETVSRAEQARAQLNASFRASQAENAMNKEVYINGEFLTRTATSLESIIQMMRGLYSEDARLICATEEREVDETSLKLEFVA